MLKVICPATYLRERAYAVNVVLGEMLGLEHHVDFGEDVSGHVRITDGESDLRVPDVLFQTPPELWLKAASLPRPPFAVHTGDGASAGLPVVLPAPGDRDSPGRGLPADVFGLAFFMLTRYEELAAPVADRWGRYPSEASLAARAGFLDRPIVDEWVDVLFRHLQSVWPRLARKPHVGKILLTHDVDLPYSPDHSPVRIARAAWGDVWRRRHPALAAQRIAATLAKATGRVGYDPFDTFDLIMDLSESHGLTSEFFFISGHVGGRVGAPLYEIEDPRTRTLLRRIASRGHRIGLHPSFNASIVPGQTKREFHILRRVCAEEGIDQPDWGSRQHYLRWFNPVSWRACEEAGLSYDSSLVYADRPGFRAGTCREFPVFDLENRRALRLRERPLIVMEDSLLGRQYEALSAAEAFAKIVELRDACFRVGGNFVLLWHNSEIVSRKRRDLYRKLVPALAGSDAKPPPGG